MKATGIVRRIDDLGRVVIPKEIRRTMRIREGDPLEIYTDKDGGVIFKKYSLMGGLVDFAGQLCDTLNRTTGQVTVITDRDSCIAVSGVPRRELADKARLALDEMLSFGTTTCEAKSGYGLDLDTELTQLRAIRALNGSHPVDLVPTFLGAHALPEDYKADRAAYIRLLCEEMIPAAAAEGLAEFCDVFCETGVFTAEESRTILEAGRRCGLAAKIHADEIDAIGGSRLAGELGAVSAEHLIVCPPEGIAAMARGGTVACLLPCTSFYLGAAFAPARDMIAAGVPVALATDFNPGSCPCLNMQLAMSLGCLKYRMTPEEVLTAVTLNGAAAIGRADRTGSVEPGKAGDLVVWNAPDLEYVCYRLGSNLAGTVVKGGKIYRNEQGPVGPGGERYGKAH